jgi:uncharacterized protein
LFPRGTESPPERIEPGVGEAGAPRRLRSVFIGPSGLRAGWRLVIFGAIVLALVSARKTLLRVAFVGADDVTVYVVNKAASFLTFLIASWVMARIERRTIAEYGLPWRQMFRSRFWIGGASGFASVSTLLLALRILGVFHFGTLVVRGEQTLEYALVFGVIFVLIGLEEEFRYRGYGLFTLASGIGFWPAAVVLSAVFGYSHSGNVGENSLGLVNAGLGGLLFCLLIRRTGNLWMAIGFHAGWDWAQSYFFGVPDSGYLLPNHLFQSGFSGPSWMTGGSVGPEGSVVCSLFFFVLAVLFDAGFRRAQKRAVER